MQAVVKLLDVMGGQRIQTNGTETRLQMIADGGLVGTDRRGFHIGQIFVLPCVQPLCNGHLVQCDVGSIIQSSGSSFQLLCHFFLCLTGDRFLNLLACAGVKADGVSGFPVFVFLSAPADDFLTDVAAACGGLLAACHKFALLSKMPNSRCMVSVPAIGHWRKDEGFFEKIFIKISY